MAHACYQNLAYTWGALLFVCSSSLRSCIIGLVFFIPAVFDILPHFKMNDLSVVFPTLDDVATIVDASCREYSR